MEKKECYTRLADLVNDVVLVDIEDQLDEIFAKVAKDKNANDKYTNEIEELHEMRNEFKAILEDIEKNDLELDECKELYDEIINLISEEE